MANIPAGMRVMPEDEREATLAILRANRADVEASSPRCPRGGADAGVDGGNPSWKRGWRRSRMRRGPSGSC